MGRMPNLQGRTLGQYELREKIGEGGMAVVYRAYQPLLAREVALKVLSTPLVSEDKIYQERFKRETAIVAALEHPHIVPIIEYGTQDDIVFVAMRLLRGGSLRDRMVAREVSQAALPAIAEVVKLIEQLSAALAYAHGRGIIHRDIKPSNIMFDESGHPYIVDFGIAKPLYTTDTLTTEGQMIGTPAYMAPELWRAAAITYATDQYALGIMTYALLTGRTAFDAATPAGLMHQHLMAQPTAMYEMRADIPNALDDVIRRAIAKNPDDRYPSITAFADALTAAAAGTDAERTNFFTAPLPTTPRVMPDTTVTPAPLPDHPTTIVTPQTAPRRRWVWMAAAVLLAAVLGGSGILLGTGDGGDTTNRDNDQPAAQAPTAEPSRASDLSPVAGPVFSADETGVVMMHFSRTDDASADVEGNLAAALTDAGVPFVAVDTPLSGALDEQRAAARTIADTYNATIAIWGSVSAGGVRYYTEAIPRRSSVQTTGAESFAIALPPTELDIFLFESRNILYVVHFVDGQLAYFEGDLDRAEASFRSAEALLTPDLEDDLQAYILYFFLGYIAQANDDLTTAIAYYDRTIARFPENFAAYLNRGNAYYAQGLVADALADMTAPSKTIQRCPAVTSAAGRCM